MRANKGEWAELYVIFKLLGEGRIYAANNQLEKDPNFYLEISKFLQTDDKNNNSEYRIITRDNEDMQVHIKLLGKDPLIIQSSTFVKHANLLLTTILESKGRSFECNQETTHFQQLTSLLKYKAKSISKNKQFGGKNDIVLEIRDPKTALIFIAGFSIKSKFKNPPTLFNGGNTSRFAYSLSNISDEQMEDINCLLTRKGGIDKEGRIHYIINNNIQMAFSHVRNLVFKENLDLIHGHMISVIDHMLQIYYLDPIKHTKIEKIVSRLIIKNPLNRNHPEIFYTKVVKDFLYATFVGMTAGHLWTGEYQVNGGYIIVKNDGDVLFYHSRDGESLRNFLFTNAKLDRPSASKYVYAYVYKKDTKYYIDLNFQIRF